MATILVKPVSTKSTGGYSATINGIEPTDHDCIHGEITAPSGVTQGQWNLNGIMRGGTTDTNIAANDPVFSDIASLAKQLGAK